jgi:hypothetical protein
VVVEKSEAVQLLNSLIDEVDAVYRDRNLFDAWQRKCRTVLDRIFGDKSSESEDLMNVDYDSCGIATIGDIRSFNQAFHNGLDEAKKVLESWIWEIQRFGLPIADNGDEAL